MDYKEIKFFLGQIDDPVQRLEFVMDLGKALAPIPQNSACTDILGCTSHVQICKSGDLFYGTADSAMVRGIVAIILAMANDKVKNIRSEFDSLNLNFGVSRLNGIKGIIEAVSD
jgi:sulfur transfer protein SufE